MKNFQPVILGSDINAYGMARAFHEAYGIVSTAFAHFQLSPTKYSRIIDMHLVEGFNQSDVFVESLVRYAQQMAASQPGTTLVLIPCGDSYANLLSRHQDELKPYYACNIISPKLNRQLSLKSSFYELCEQYNLPHPQTVSLSPSDVASGMYRKLPFDFPVAMKPADSDAWLSIDFPGRTKAFIIQSAQELETLILRSYQAGYQGDMIIQDFIPGDDSQMRVLNAYVDQHHRVRMMFLGHPLLEDPTPEAVGNYAAILPDYQEEIFGPIKDFLENINYCGVANFDMKFDERDGQYKLFEINLRQGRSSYFLTLNDCNLASYFVDDLVEDTSFDGQAFLARGSRLWMEIPRSIFVDYVEPGADKERGLELLNNGNWGTTLEYKKDMSVLRWLMIRHMFHIYKKRYKQYFQKKVK